MPTTYLLTNQAEAQGWATALFEQKMLTSAGTATTQSTSLASLALDVLVGAFIAPEGAGTLDWIGTVSFQLEVTTAAADVGVLLLLARVSQDGASSRGASGSSYQYGTGIKTLSSTLVEGLTLNSNASRASTDRFVVYFRGRNDNMMIAQTLGWAVNDPDSFATGYWTVGGGAAPMPRRPTIVLQAVQRSAVR